MIPQHVAETAPGVCRLIRKCWRSNPANRPDFNEVARYFGKLQGSLLAAGDGTEGSGGGEPDEIEATEIFQVSDAILTIQRHAGELPSAPKLLEELRAKKIRMTSELAHAAAEH